MALDSYVLHHEGRFLCSCDALAMIAIFLTCMIHRRTRSMAINPGIWKCHCPWVPNLTYKNVLSMYCSVSMLSWQFIINPSVEFAVCEVRNFFCEWRKKHRFTGISMSSQALTIVRLLDVLECGKCEKYAIQKVWNFLLQYFSVLQRLQILSMASSFTCIIDQSKSHDNCM